MAITLSQKIDMLNDDDYNLVEDIVDRLLRSKERLPNLGVR